MDIPGFKKVSYEQLQIELHKKRADDESFHELAVATKIEVKSVGTVRNCFDTQRQSVSDEIFTRLFKAINLNAVILWSAGERNYFIKK